MANFLLDFLVLLAVNLLLASTRRLGDDHDYTRCTRFNGLNLRGDILGVWRIHKIEDQRSSVVGRGICTIAQSWTRMHCWDKGPQTMNF